jgi:peptide/nickel transport system substrate-binding protein
MFKKAIGICSISALLLLIGCGGGTDSSGDGASGSSDAAEATATSSESNSDESSDEASSAQKPYGTLTFALEGIGPVQLYHPTTADPAQRWQTTHIFETGFKADADTTESTPWLIKNWSVSADNKTWTFELEEGIQFHRGWGEFTAEDFVWNVEINMPEDVLNITGSVLNRVINPAGGGYIKATGSHTVEIFTGDRDSFDLLWPFTYGKGVPIPMQSKAYVESVGPETAAVDNVGTGSWEWVEGSSNDFLRFKAVEGHWRNTPNFEFFEMLEIPEESTRIAAFEAGQIDILMHNLDSIPAIEKVEGAQFVQTPGALLWLNLHGNNCSGDPAPLAGNQPWVSSNCDLNSQEWKNAVKVRQALSLAVDRQSIVNNLLLGFGNVASSYTFHNLEGLAPFNTGDVKFGYDVAGAKKLMAEAGYADGFEINMALTTRPAPANQESGEAICVMWQELNVTCSPQERVGMGDFRPYFIDRNFEGANTHAGGPGLEPSGAYQFMHSRNLLNFSGTHPELDRLIEVAESTWDFDDRVQAGWAIEQFLHDNMMNIPTVGTAGVYAIGPKIAPWHDQAGAVGGDIDGFELVPHAE